jgi:hypothetical protein
MIRKLILALSILALTTTPALARGGGGGFQSGGGGGFHGGSGGGFHGGAMGGFHGGGVGGFHGGGVDGFHGHGEERFHGRGEGRFHGGGRGAFRDGHDRFDHFHRFGFAGPAFDFGVPFFWDPFWFPGPYPAYAYAPPLLIQPEPQESLQQPPSPKTPTYWYYCVDAKAYYPYTQQCPGGWLKVAPTPVG